MQSWHLVLASAAAGRVCAASRRFAPDAAAAPGPGHPCGNSVITGINQLRHARLSSPKIAEDRAYAEITGNYRAGGFNRWLQRFPDVGGRCGCGIAGSSAGAEGGAGAVLGGDPGRAAAG